MIILAKEEAEKFLSLPELSDFWHEIGSVSELPNHFVYLHDDDGCLIILEPFDDVPGFTGIHIAVMPESRGKKAVKFAKLCIDWAFSEMFTIKVVARIEKNRKNVIRFSELAGMKKYNEDETHVFCEVNKCL